MRACAAVVFSTGILCFLSGLQPAYAQSYGSAFNPLSRDPCDPGFAGYHVNQTTAMFAQQQCAAARQQRQRQLQAQADERQRLDIARQAEEEQRSEQQRAIDKAVTHGYELIPMVGDLILDGRQLANRNAKIQISGIYKRVGDSERLYARPSDSIRNNDNYLPLLTDNAVRDFRKFLLDNPTCREQSWGNTPGCSVDVGGHMTMCHRLAAEFANYPEVPCLSIDVQIVYRPGD